jgi:biotin transport system substrate-specific component
MNTIMVNEKNSTKVRRNRYVFTAVFAAMIAVSGFLIVPLPGGIPIVLKNLFIVLSGTVLGSFYGGIALVIFLISGIIGIPVFVIPGGIGAFQTPIGGFLYGYLIASLADGFIMVLPKLSEKNVRPIFIIKLSIVSFLAFIIILVCGSFHMMILNHLSVKAALLAGFVPFIIGDTIKCIISIPLALALRPIAARYINPEGDVLSTL